jgi:outer membrane immunogenic protein
MHRLLLTILLTTAAIPALAADLPGKAPARPAPAPVADWTGFYIGIHGGYGWGKAGLDDAALNSDVSEELHLSEPKGKGAVFGAHAGYNWQLGQRWVAGLEIDYSAARIKDTQSASFDFDCCLVTRTLEAKIDRLASVRARMGFLVMPEFLLYGTGGLAWANLKVTDTFAQPNDLRVFQSDTNRFGWAAGAGGEWKLWNSGLMFRVEYLHYDFGAQTFTFSNFHNNDHFDDPVAVLGKKLTADVVRGGLSLKF